MMMMKLVMARKLVPIGIRIPIDRSTIPGRQTTMHGVRAPINSFFFLLLHGPTKIRKRGGGTREKGHEQNCTHLLPPPPPPPPPIKPPPPR